MLGLSLKNLLSLNKLKESFRNVYDNYIRDRYNAIIYDRYNRPLEKR